ncbi:MAG: hypothetical protein C0494_08165 [Sphingobium sp.]|nr:hypothetical protein [Sphingobium sp.]
MPITFHQAFDIWIARDDAPDAATAQGILNKIIPPVVQAAASVRGDIRREGWRWFQQHGFDANITRCIKYLKAGGWTTRRYRHGELQLTDSEIRKILRSLGIKGKAGRPKCP